MPFAMILIGVMLFITALNGTFSQLGSQLYKDLFTNSPSFFYWALAVIIVGMIGYIPGAKKPADAFMALIIIAMVLKTKGGLFTNIQSAFSTTATPAQAANPLAPIPVGSNSNASSASPTNVTGALNSVIGSAEKSIFGGISNGITGAIGNIGATQGVSSVVDNADALTGAFS